MGLARPEHPPLASLPHPQTRAHLTVEMRRPLDPPLRKSARRSACFGRHGGQEVGRRRTTEACTGCARPHDSAGRRAAAASSARSWCIATVPSHVEPGVPSLRIGRIGGSDRIGLRRRTRTSSNDGESSRRSSRSSHRCGSTRTERREGSIRLNAALHDAVLSPIRSSQISWTHCGGSDGRHHRRRVRVPLRSFRRPGCGFRHSLTHVGRRRTASPGSRWREFATRP
jgi:hypothetical protein